MLFGSDALKLSLFALNLCWILLAGLFFIRRCKFSSASAVCCELGISTLSSRRKFHLAQTVFKCLYSPCPTYLSQLFPTPSSSYHTRSSSSSQLNLPAARSSYGQRAFSFAGASVWRSLPATTREIRDFQVFSAKCEDLLIWLILLACAWLNPALYYFACLHDYILIFILHKWLHNRRTYWSTFCVFPLCLCFCTLFLSFCLLGACENSLWLKVPQSKYDPWSLILYLAGLHWQSCLVYLDDVLILGRSFSEHLHNLRDIFDRLQEAGLKLKPSKCTFGQ